MFFKIKNGCFNCCKCKRSHFYKSPMVYKMSQISTKYAKKYKKYSHKSSTEIINHIIGTFFIEFILGITIFVLKISSTIYK